METLAISLEPYKNIIINVASIGAYLTQLSKIIVCNTIRKQNSTVGHSILPFLTGVVISGLGLGFGCIISDGILIQVNFFKTVIGLAYMFVFFYYTNNPKDRQLAWRQVTYAGAFMAAVFAYTLIENSNVLKFRFSLISLSVFFFSICSEFYKVPKVIRAKNSAGLPFPILVSGSFITFMWFLYGILKREMLLIIQYGIFCSMSSILTILCLIYPAKVILENDCDSKQSEDNIKKQN